MQEAENVHVYLKTIIKQEGERGQPVTIQLRVTPYNNAELGEHIENPIVVEDADP